MDRERISDLMLSLPTWMRADLAAPDKRLRERAADAIAATLVNSLDQDKLSDGGPSQLALTL
jgi:hypothetical protein